MTDEGRGPEGGGAGQGPRRDAPGKPTAKDGGPEDEPAGKRAELDSAAFRGTLVGQGAPPPAFGVPPGPPAAPGPGAGDPGDDEPSALVTVSQVNLPPSLGGPPAGGRPPGSRVGSTLREPGGPAPVFDSGTASPPAPSGGEGGGDSDYGPRTIQGVGPAPAMPPGAGAPAPNPPAPSPPAAGGAAESLEASLLGDSDDFAPTLVGRGSETLGAGGAAPAAAEEEPARLTRMAPAELKGQTLEIPSRAGAFRVARSPDAQVPLYSPEASRDHARLVHHKGAWFVDPLPGKVVKVGRRTAKGRTPLGAKATLRFGGDVLAFRSGTVAAGASRGRGLAWVVLGGLVLAGLVLALHLFTDLLPF